MATAISYKSESMDDYLSLFDNGESIEEIVEKEKKMFGDEWEYLDVLICKSSEHDTTALRKALIQSMSEE